MMTLVPNRLLFQFEFPMRYRADAAKRVGAMDHWGDDDRLPDLGALDGRRGFAEIYACWHESGLAFACCVDAKRRPLRCDPKRFWTGDNLRLCTDMRDARANKRATRYCQQFYFLPTGGGSRGRDPVAGVNAIQRARESAPHVPESHIQVAADVTQRGYTLQAFIPAECLSGFDPAEHPRIGFYYIVEDSELGQQYLTVGDDLNWYVDPSTWATAVLTR